ncbi:MAG: SBBP repeat-containing protein [Ignavibacteriae bacterium]|nr:SBBP repeat-containing protein [Ignavibacteriota bacterium]MCB9244599.1 SBBP repeat-containing protein [Ignavibacteriales bacterium]
MKTALTFTAIFLAVISFFSQSVNAQVSESWVKQYNGTADGYDYAESIVTDDAGNSYVIGSSDSTGLGDIVTIKYSPSGTMLWVKKYDGTAHGDDRGIAITMDDSSNVYVTGYSEGIGTAIDIVTIKYSSSGETKWVSRFDGAMHMTESPYCITLDGAGNVYVGGSGPSMPGESFDFLTLKYTPSGGFGWVRYFDRPIPGGAEHPTAITAHGSAIYITGISVAPGFMDLVYTVGYSASGDTLFETPYSGTGLGGRKASSIAVSPITGAIYVCGHEYSGSPVEGINYLTIKYSPSGMVTWAKHYNGTDSDVDEATKIAVDATESIYVTGFSSGISSAYDYVTIKYSAMGDTIWTARYNNSEDGDDRAEDIKVDASGNVYVTGWSRDFGSRYDYLTVKYSPTGSLLWDIRHDATSATIDSKAFALGLDAMGNVYVTGVSNGPTGNEDITTIKYVEVMTGVTGNTNSTPEGFELKQNYPNPFNPSTKISFSLPNAGMTTLKIYDMAGKEVAQLVNGNMNAGTHEFNFDATGLSSGVYFYTLQSGEFMETKKMNLIK